MKILQINAVYGFGSTGLIVKDIENCIENNGDEAYVAYATANEKPKRGYKIGNKFDRKVHAVYARVFGKQAYASKRATKKLLKWIDKVAPDAVHLHNLHSNYINLNLLLDYLAKKDILTVITLHDCWFFTGKCTHYVVAKCDKWQTTCGECPLLKGEVPSLFFDKTEQVLLDKTNRLNKIPRLKIVGCSKWICEQANNSRLGGCYVTQIYNGVDTSVFKPCSNDELNKKYNFENSFVIMGMANKWLQPSNKALLEKTVSILSDNTKLMIVGCTQPQIELLRAKSDHVLPIGFINDRVELARHYSLADVFVNVTHADTLPTVNMESICCGTPVVTFDSCGSPELVDKGSGFVVPEGDVDGIIEKINSLKENPMAINIEAKHKKFDKNNCYEKYLEVYKVVEEEIC